MPTINDATVVASAYTPYESCRPQHLSNGWIVSAEYNGSSAIMFQVDKRDGNGFIPLCFVNIVSVGASMIRVGTLIYLVYGNSTQVRFLKFDATTVTNIDLSSTSSVLETSGLVDSLSINTNNANTELHIVVSDRDNTTNTLVNLRYYKGIINSDKSVTFNSVEVVTNVTSTTVSGPIFHNVGIVIGADNIPTIFAYTTYYFFTSTTVATNSNSGIICLRRDASLTTGNSSILSSWSYKYVSNQVNGYNPPSVMYIPKEINGLTNGRFCVVYSPYSAASLYPLIFAYSDDNCVTWTITTVIATGDNRYYTISANRKNEIYIVYCDVTNSNLYKITNSNGVWGAATLIKLSNTSPAPTSLITFAKGTTVTSPLFIYKDSSKVGFYGIWTNTSINVVEGSIGLKTISDLANFLSYAITTDGTMNSITESINGQTVTTKTATSSQSLICILTKLLWDSIKYGKYSNPNGALNTLLITMNDGAFDNTWTFTFDKRLLTTDDVLSAVKAIQDSQTTYLPAVKAKLGGAIRGKGGTVNDTDSFDVIKSAIDSLSKKPLSGTVTTDSTGKFAISGLSINPKMFYAKMVSSTNDQYDFILFVDKSLTGTTNGENLAMRTGQASSMASPLSVVGNAVSIPTANTTYIPASTQYSWVASE